MSEETLKKAWHCGWTAGFGLAAIAQVDGFAQPGLTAEDMLPAWVAQKDSDAPGPWRAHQAKFQEGFTIGGLAGAEDVEVSRG